MWAVSRVIPRKVREVDGPYIFSEASVTPKSVHSSIKDLRLCLHSGEQGGPVSRKSSR